MTIDIKAIGAKWQAKWKKEKTYKTTESSDKPKFYALDMFPYPSGSGLHVGHPKGYLATDSLARLKMLQGYNVLHPMGFDAFGLPAEQYAIKNKVNPAVSTATNVARYKEQLESMGFTYDRDREVQTTDPTFYKWTQWAFLKLYNHYYDAVAGTAKPIAELEKKLQKQGLTGTTLEKELDQHRLAFVDYKPINWCPSCKTGLANEDLDNGKCERCGSEVEQKPMRQWVIRITDYAERLLQGLDELPEWPDNVKEMQRNWIGKSEGTEFVMQVANMEHISKVIVLHGITADSNRHRFQWLKTTLGNAGIPVYIPNLPNTQNPILDEQLAFLEKEFGTQIDENTIIIGHSLGGFLAPHFVAKMGKKIKKLIMIAPVVEEMTDLLEFVRDGVTAYIKGSKLDTKKVSKLVDEHIILLSQSDPVTGYKQVKKYCDATFSDAHIVSFADAGHFSDKFGNYLQFPELLQYIIPKTAYDFSIYTTRIDTVFGMSFVALAPEHPLVREITTKEHTKAVAKYVKDAANKTSLERDAEKEKTGVFTGAYAINPFNNQPVPIWVADYVLMGYGSGAVMAVPAHDERDRAFAKKYDLPIVQSIAPLYEAKRDEYKIRQDKKTTTRNVSYAIVKNPVNNKYLILDLIEQKEQSLVVGGVEKDEDNIQAIKREIYEETGYKNLGFIKQMWPEIHTSFYATHKDENRYAMARCFVFELVDETHDTINSEESAKHNVLWLDAKEVNLQYGNQDVFWQMCLHGEKALTDIGILINSGSYTSPVTKKTIVILHGTEGNSTKNWYPWLQQTLEKFSYTIIVPDMPKSDRPDLSSWLQHLEQYQDQIDEDTIIIGHSLGAPTAIQWIQKMNKKIDELILVAPTHGDIDRKEYNTKVPADNNDCIQKVSQTTTDWNKVKSLISHAYAFFSPNDPYIPMEVKKFYERDLKAETIVLENKGHFNLSGLKSDKFPEILQYIANGKNALWFNGLTSNEAIPAMQARLAKQGIGGVKVQYRLQDWVFSRQRYWGEPIPMIHGKDGKIIPMDEKDLPLKLPMVEAYEPTGSEEGPLAAITDWVNTPEGKRESNTMPQWAGSSRYWLRYMDPNNSKALVGKDKEKYRGQVDVYVGGLEHATRHLIYGRFWHKFLYDLGVVSTSEPFKKLYGVGLVLAEDGRKMSKRWNNVINPDEVIGEYGADAFRTYEMFMGPFENEVARSTAGVKGVKKFLDKICRLVDKMNDEQDSKDVQALLHKSIKKVGEDIENFRFNTAVSQLMILVNGLTEQKAVSKDTIKTLALIVAPFAPHLAEEIWEQLGEKFSIFHTGKRPQFDPKLVVEDSITMAVQFNGKVKGTINVAVGASQDDVIAIVKNDSKLQKQRSGEAKKIIYVPGKIVNIIL